MVYKILKNNLSFGNKKKKFRKKKNFKSKERYLIIVFLFLKRKVKKK